MTTAEYLNDLITAKEYMKSAIIGKGVTPTGGLSTYADAIRSLKQNPSDISYDIKFYGSTELTTIPEFNTSSYTDMSYMFYNCRSLTTVPLFNTSNVTSMYNMFYMCMSLTTVPLFNTSNVTSMRGMFGGCDSLTTVPLFNTSNVTNMYYMFGGCDSLTTVPLFNTSNVTNMQQMFNSCSSLTTVPLFDTSNVTNMQHMFTGCSSLITLSGLKDLGKQASLNGTDSMIKNCPNLTYESIMNVINNLYDRASAGYSVLTLKLHANTLALLSDEDKAIATNKGWIIE